MTFDALRNWMLGRLKDERQLFDLLSTGVWITDAALNTHCVNPSMAVLLGRAGMLDITTRRQVEDALRRAGALHRGIDRRAHRAAGDRRRHAAIERFGAGRSADEEPLTMEARS